MRENFLFLFLIQKTAAAIRLISMRPNTNTMATVPPVPMPALSVDFNFADVLVIGLIDGGGDTLRIYFGDGGGDTLREIFEDTEEPGGAE